MRLPSRESLKDVFRAAFLFIVVALMIDQIDQGLPLRTEHIEIALICLGSVAIYVRLLRRTRSNTLGRSYGRAALFCGLMFSTGFLAGIVRASVEGWGWSDAGLIVPGLMAWFCLKLLFHAAQPAAATPPSGGNSA